MVVIPAGSFAMGSPEDEEGRQSAEGPQHRVTFATPFALGKYPVTFDEYDHFCIERRRRKSPDQGWGRGRRPVVNVSWEDAKAYCTWLSAQSRQVYRLPSEAEWEYACRAGTTTPFWTGGTITKEQASYDLNGEQTSTVDNFAANYWRLHDMHGNVGEWCEDWWNDNYQGAPQDGSAWLTGPPLVAWCAAALGMLVRAICAPRTARAICSASEARIWAFGCPRRLIRDFPALCSGSLRPRVTGPVPAVAGVYRREVPARCRSPGPACAGDARP